MEERPGKNRKENEVALQRAEMRMVRWMCGMKLQDKIPSKGLRERLRLDENPSTTAERVVMVWHSCNRVSISSHFRHNGP